MLAKLPSENHDYYITQSLSSTFWHKMSYNDGKRARVPIKKIDYSLCGCVLYIIHTRIINLRKATYDTKQSVLFIIYWLNRQICSEGRDDARRKSRHQRCALSRLFPLPSPSGMHGARLLHCFLLSSRTESIKYTDKLTNIFQWKEL